MVLLWEYKCVYGHRLILWFLKYLSDVAKDGLVGRQLQNKRMDRRLLSSKNNLRGDVNRLFLVIPGVKGIRPKIHSSGFFFNSTPQPLV